MSTSTKTVVVAEAEKTITVMLSMNNVTTVVVGDSSNVEEIMAKALAEVGVEVSLDSLLAVDGSGASRSVVGTDEVSDIDTIIVDRERENG